MPDLDRGGESASGHPPLPPATTQWTAPDAVDPGATARMLPPFHSASFDALAEVTAPIEAQEGIAQEPAPITPSAETAETRTEEDGPIEWYEGEAVDAEAADSFELDAVDLQMEVIEQDATEPPPGVIAEWDAELLLEDIYQDLDTGPAPEAPAEFAPEAIALDTEAPYDADAGYELDAMTLPESLAEAELVLTDEVENFLLDTGVTAAPELTAGPEAPVHEPVASAGDELELAAAEDEGWAPGEPPPPGFVQAEAATDAGDLAEPAQDEEQPWEAFGRAMRDALSWADLAAEEVPPAEPASPLAEAITADAPIEPPLVQESAETVQPVAEAPAADEAPGSPAVDPIIAVLADRLQALADRLRADGVGGLAEAIARGERLESSLALFLAGYRAGRGE